MPPGLLMSHAWSSDLPCAGALTPRTRVPDTAQSEQATISAAIPRGTVHPLNSSLAADSPRPLRAHDRLATRQTKPAASG